MGALDREDGDNEKNREVEETYAKLNSLKGVIYL
jgi:hypothetical protein